MHEILKITDQVKLHLNYVNLWIVKWHLELDNYRSISNKLVSYAQKWTDKGQNNSNRRLKTEWQQINLKC